MNFKEKFYELSEAKNSLLVAGVDTATREMKNSPSYPQVEKKLQFSLDFDLLFPKTSLLFLLLGDSLRIRFLFLFLGDRHKNQPSLLGIFESQKFCKSVSVGL